MTHHRALATGVPPESEFAAIDAGSSADATADEVRRLDGELQEAYAKLRRAEERNDTLKELIARIEGSGSYRLAHSLAETSRRMAPAGTRRRRVLSGALAIPMAASADPRLLLSLGQPLDSVDLRWNRFCRRHDPSAARLQALAW